MAHHKRKAEYEIPVVDENDLLKLTPLGAGNEVGRSSILLEYKGKTILVRKKKKKKNDHFHIFLVWRSCAIFFFPYFFFLYFFFPFLFPNHIPLRTSYILSLYFFFRQFLA